MKTSKIFSTAMMLGLVAMMWSCNEVDEPIIDGPESTFVKDNSLLATNSVTDRLRDSGFGGPTAFIFGRFYGGEFGGRSDVHSPRQMMNKLMGKNFENARVSDGVCFTESFTEFDDGSYEYVLDYGDGCDGDGEFLKGKIIETGSYTESTFEDHIEYIHFGGEDWEIHGTEDYEGTYSESVDLDVEEMDSLYEWSTSYSFAADLVEQFVDFAYDEETDEFIDGETVELIYVANGSETMDEDGYLVESRDESYEVNTGESFTSKVDVPLFMDFNCDSDGIFEEDETVSSDDDYNYVWTFVSGVESGSYSYPDDESDTGIVTGTYSINYGDGTCDNIIEITENGVTEEIDLGDEWDEWEDECGDEDHEDGDSDEDNG